MLVLGIESSCDETGVAIFDTHQGLIAHCLHSQIALHAEYGGVVPELASRDHIRRILPLIKQTLDASGKSLKSIDAIAYTEGPGLGGALLVGAASAHALGFALQKPVIAVHHLEGHLLSPMLADPRPEFPFVALLVSGGHSQLMAVRAVGEYELLGETLDDAAGEAFDKTAKLLGLPYPGGAKLSQLAEHGDAMRFHFPRPMLKHPTLDMSFAGLKTAVLTTVRQLEYAQGAIDDQTRADICASFQAAMVDVLLGKSMQAIELTGFSRLVLAGGVGANRALRMALNEVAERKRWQIFYPPLELCTDNGAMIALAGAFRLHHAQKAGGFSVKPRWDLSSLNAI